MALRTLLIAMVMCVPFQESRPKLGADPYDDVARAAAAIPNLLAALRERVDGLTPEAASTDDGKALVVVARHLDEALGALKTVELVLYLERRAFCESDREMIRARVQEILVRLVNAVARAASTFGKSVDALDAHTDAGALAARAKVQLECVTVVLRRSAPYRAAIANRPPRQKYPREFVGQVPVCGLTCACTCQNGGYAFWSSGGRVAPFCR